MSYGKRGMGLETLIETTNKIYKIKNLAIVEKVPTPWKVYYDKRSKGSSATPEKKSSVDFNGMIKGGQAIYFEAKSTTNKTSFPLKNIKQHQIQYLIDVKNLGAIAFFIIEFAYINERYYVSPEFVGQYWNAQYSGGRKSIPLNEIRENGTRIPITNVPVDYIQIITNKEEK